MEFMTSPKKGHKNDHIEVTVDRIIHTDLTDSKREVIDFEFSSYDKEFLLRLTRDEALELGKKLISEAQRINELDEEDEEDVDKVDDIQDKIKEEEIYKFLGQ